MNSKKKIREFVLLEKSTPRKWGKPGVGIEKEKYSFPVNFIDKTCKVYLFIFD